MYLKDEEINGYVLTERLRKARRRHHLSAPCQALYHELVAICNEEGWEDVFKCSNDELTKALNVTEKSLINYRLELIQAGLVGYKSGKTKKIISDYSFTKNLNGCKIYSQNGSQSDSQNGSQSDSQMGEKSSDIIKGKTKTKIKTNTSANAHPKKLFWKSFIEVFENFYLHQFQNKYSYLGKDFKCLEKIYEFLQKRVEQKGNVWTEELMKESFNFFLKVAFSKDNWLKSNFSTANILSQFNSIVNGKSNSNSTNEKSSSSGKQQTGADILAAKLAANIASFTGGGTENTRS